MKFHIIDPNRQLIFTCETSEWNLDVIYSMLGCSTITIGYRWEHQGVLYCDDEAMFTPDLAGFHMYGSKSPIFGKALIVDGDDEGNDQDVKISLAEFKRAVTWSAYRTAGLP